jgi:uncharacterized protein (DUF2267 family)
MSENTPEALRTLAERLRSRADLAQELHGIDATTVRLSVHEARQLADYLAAQSEPPQDDMDALVMAQLIAQAWCQGVRPRIEASNADEFVSAIIRAIRAEPPQEGWQHKLLEALAVECDCRVIEKCSRCIAIDALPAAPHRSEKEQ